MERYGIYMKIDTKYFGTVDIEDEKIIHFDTGLFGFEDYKDYTILYDLDAKGETAFSWLQSTSEQGLAFPIINPFVIDKEYNPIVNDEIFKTIGEADADNMAVFLLATVPADVKKATVNMKAPLIINSETRKGIQAIVENEEYEIKHKIIK